MKLKINFPEHVEAVDVVPHGEHYKLTKHSYFLPLAPGDIVTAADDVVTGVVHQEPVFIVEAFFAIGTPPETVRAKAREWARATHVTQSTALTVLVSSTSHQWITDVVEPEAWDMQLVRTPGQTFDFKEKVAQA